MCLSGGSFGAGITCVLIWRELMLDRNLKTRSNSTRKLAMHHTGGLAFMTDFLDSKLAILWETEEKWGMTGLLLSVLLCISL